MHTRPAAPPVSIVARLQLLWRIWRTAAFVGWELRHRPVGQVATELALPVGREPRPVSLLNRAISRGLRFGPWQPRCLIRALVLYHLLRAQGDAAELVIGLHQELPTPRAHAWVELNGQDVGPPPGSRGYAELSRFPASR